MGVQQLRSRAPSLGPIARAHRHEVAIGVDMVVGLLTEGLAIRGASKGDEDLAVGPPYDRWKRTVEARPVIEDGILDLV